MTLRTQKKLILARAAGAGAFIAGDAVEAGNVELTPLAGDEVVRELERPYYHNDMALVANAHQTLKFDCEYAPGADVAGGEPWRQLLKACGFAVTEQAADPAANPPVPATNTYNPITDNPGTVKLGYNMDGILHTLDKCRGSVSLALAANQIPKWTFSFTGLYAEPVAVAPLPGDYTAWQRPQVGSKGNTPTVAILGENDLPLTSFSLDMAVAVRHRTLINADAEVIITGRAPTAELVVDAKANATWIRKAKASDTDSVTIVHGKAGGRQLQLTLSKAQLGQGVEYQDDDGVLQFKLPLRLLPTAGNDELTLIVS